MSNSLWSHGRNDSLLCPWDFPGKNAGMGKSVTSPGDLPDWSKGRMHLCCIAGGFFTIWATKEAPQVHVSLLCECMFLGSLSHHNKDLEWWTLKPPWRVTALGFWIDRVISLRSWKDHALALRQISVIALFYLEESRKIHLQGMRAHWSKDTKRRAPQCAGERERASFGSSFYMFLSPWACPM